jgi:Spy/CpxP family protein refolding chaperone
MNTVRTLLTAALAVAALAVPSHASARPAPHDPPPRSPATAHTTATGGRTDQQFWGQATWLNPLSGLNLDRTAATS